MSTIVPPFNANRTSPTWVTDTELLLSALNPFSIELNETSSLLNLAKTATSTTSNTIGTGAKTFTVAAGLGFQTGNPVRAANTSSAYMDGSVTSYSGTTLIINVTSIVGSGTFTSWRIDLSAVGASSASSISFSPQGNIAATTVQSAIEELDTEKLSSSGGAVSSFNLASVTTGATVGGSGNIPSVTYNDKGQIVSSFVEAKINPRAAIITTSGVAHEFTSINAANKRIVFMIRGLSTSGTSMPIIQLGTATAYATASYEGTLVADSAAANSMLQLSAGVALDATWAATYVKHGVITFTRIDNVWFYTGEIGSTDSARLTTVAGAITLAEPLTRIKIMTTNGTDTFDAGFVAINLE